MGKDRRKETGRIGEQWACRYLEKKGWTLLERNWRTRIGELDIIARNQEQIIVVEVRTTRHNRFGLGFQSVNSRKQHQVRRLAAQYIQLKGLQDVPLRLDVISVLLSPSDRPIRLDHLEGAF